MEIDALTYVLPALAGMMLSLRFKVIAAIAASMGAFATVLLATLAVGESWRLAIVGGAGAALILQLSYFLTLLLARAHESRASEADRGAFFSWWRRNP